MSLEESLKYLMPFGKHQGKPLEGILLSEPTYVTEFLAKIALKDPLQNHVKNVVADYEKQQNHEEQHEPDDDRPLLRR